MMLACGGACAEDARKSSPFTSDDLFFRQKACKGFGDIAETIMKQRQKEVPMSEMIDRLQKAQAMGIFEGFDLTPDLLAAMVTAAYKQPAFSSPELQANMIAAYRNEAEVLCFEGKLGTTP
jgi:hypothetical protein